MSISDHNTWRLSWHKSIHPSYSLNGTPERICTFNESRSWTAPIFYQHQTEQHWILFLWHQQSPQFQHTQISNTVQINNSNQHFKPKFTTTIQQTIQTNNSNIKFKPTVQTKMNPTFKPTIQTNSSDQNSNQHFKPKFKQFKQTIHTNNSNQNWNTFFFTNIKQDNIESCSCDISNFHNSDNTPTSTSIEQHWILFFWH